jgi:hypothetical protein
MLYAAVALLSLSPRTAAQNNGYIDALQENRAPAPEPIVSKKCTPDQIEQMIDARFTLEEIYSICNIAESVNASTPAGEILQRVAETLANCSTYIDHGVQHTKWIKPERESEQIAFSTAFIRPHHFRFEYAAKWKSGPSNRIVYMEDKTIQSKWNRQSPKIKQEKSLTDALAGTGWLGVTIPRLLLPTKMESWSLLQMEKIERMTDKPFDGKSHYRIKGYHPMGEADEPILLWIEKSTYLIRKIERVTKSNNCLARETTIINAHININLTADKLDFEQGPQLSPSDFSATIKLKTIRK